MLEDDALSAPALMAIDAGTTADEAWTNALDGEIAGYEASDDDYFRARAADLKDMRDRVLRHLSGEASISAPEGAVLVGEEIARGRMDKPMRGRFGSSPNKVIR